MFGSKQRKSKPVDSLIGPNTRVNGDLHFASGCHIDGLVKGNVSADPEGDAWLSIAEEGTVEGGVAVPHIELHGIVRGDVFANQRIELGPTARVIGDVYYNLIEMAIGAEINGKLVHQPEGQMPLLDRGINSVESPVKVVSST